MHITCTFSPKHNLLPDVVARFVLDPIAKDENDLEKVFLTPNFMIEVIKFN